MTVHLREPLLRRLFFRDRPELGPPPLSTDSRLALRLGADWTRLVGVSAFNSRANVEEAMERVRAALA